MAITCPVNGTGVCDTMAEAGAGLGIFLGYIVQSLPLLLITLAMVSIVVAIGVGIGYLITHSFKTTHVRR